MAWTCAEQRKYLPGRISRAQMIAKTKNLSVNNMYTVFPFARERKAGRDDGEDQGRGMGGVGCVLAAGRAADPSA
ncbi:MAG: hypothetical protein ACRD22_18110, partial [Terriglobia bacterium]